MYAWHSDLHMIPTSFIMNDFSLGASFFSWIVICPFPTRMLSRWNSLLSSLKPTDAALVVLLRRSAIVTGPSETMVARAMRNFRKALGLVWSELLALEFFFG